MYAWCGFAAMAHCRRHRLAIAGAVLGGLVAGTSGAGVALAQDAGVSAGPQAELCPSPEAVWSYIAQLVPSAATQLASAKERVDIVDLGDRYRVHVVTDEGALERTYADRSRDCDQRMRFAAEFIVLALLPPQMLLANPPPVADAGAPPPPGPTSFDGAAPGAEAVSPAAPVRGPEPPPPPDRRLAPPPRPPNPHVTGSVVRLEAAAVAELSAPVMSAPAVTMWGGELRVRVGAGAIAGVAAVGYMPSEEFGVGAFRASLTRVPAMAGIRLRSQELALDVTGDIGVTAIVERYEGLDLHTPADATMFMPGLEVGASISPRPYAGLSALTSVRATWLPAARDIVALPSGVLGKTPTLWIGVAVGISLEL